MKDFIYGSGNYGRRTRIVTDKPINNPTVACCGRDIADCDCRVLITRAVTVKQLVPLHLYDPATVQGAREYEIDLPPAEQAELVRAAMDTPDDEDVQIEYSVRVDNASPDFTFDK